MCDEGAEGKIHAVVQLKDMIQVGGVCKKRSEDREVEGGRVK